MKPAATLRYKHITTNVEMFVDLDPNESPINLFKIDEEQFPSAAFIKKFSKTLERGDCIYIPAFYFYQVKGEGSNVYVDNPPTDYTASVITVSLKYKVHSQLLASFYEAIEAKILQWY